MKVKIEVLEKQCHKLMMMKFGREVDLEALQTLSGNRRLEELKQEKLLREAAYAKEIKQWDAKVEEARDRLMEVTRCNTERVLCMTTLMDQNRELERKINASQRKMGNKSQDYRRGVDQVEIQRLQQLVKTQSQQAEALRREIGLLSRKGGHVLPPAQARLPPITALPNPTGRTKTSTQGPGRLLSQVKAPDSSRQGVN
ncbi:hypothetical protein OYC64_019511 [Pagothenia borchgrevinki]|uniref:Uncharacterized protein n=1 Tax=Pagothenia borchgrevinki TaxID=8213 RepID=A0ABD2FI68_PAGBO